MARLNNIQHWALLQSVSLLLTLSSCQFVVVTAFDSSFDSFHSISPNPISVISSKTDDSSDSLPLSDFDSAYLNSMSSDESDEDVELRFDEPMSKSLAVSKGFTSPMHTADAVWTKASLDSGAIGRQRYQRQLFNNNKPAELISILQHSTQRLQPKLSSLPFKPSVLKSRLSAEQRGLSPLLCVPSWYVDNPSGQCSLKDQLLSDEATTLLAAALHKWTGKNIARYKLNRAKYDLINKITHKQQNQRRHKGQVNSLESEESDSMTDAMNEILEELGFNDADFEFIESTSPSAAAVASSNNVSDNDGDGDSTSLAAINSPSIIDKLLSAIPSLLFSKYMLGALLIASAGFCVWHFTHDWRSENPNWPNKLKFWNHGFFKTVFKGKTIDGQEIEAAESEKKVQTNRKAYPDDEADVNNRHHDIPNPKPSIHPADVCPPGSNAAIQLQQQQQQQQNNHTSQPTATGTAQTTSTEVDTSGTAAEAAHADVLGAIATHLLASGTAASEQQASADSAQFPTQQHYHHQQQQLQHEADNKIIYEQVADGSVFEAPVELNQVLPLPFKASHTINPKAIHTARSPMRARVIDTGLVFQPFHSCQVYLDCVAVTAGRFRVAPHTLHQAARMQRTELYNQHSTQTIRAVLEQKDSRLDSNQAAAVQFAGKLLAITHPLCVNKLSPAHFSNKLN